MSTSTKPGGPMADDHSRAGAVRMFSIVNGLTLLGVLLQAVWAGEFIDRTERGTWITVHEIGAFVVVVPALATALAAVRLRRAHSALAPGAIALLLLIVAQTAIGEAITKSGATPLIAAHVTIAMLIVALATYLSIAGAQLRRSPPPLPHSAGSAG